MSIFSSLFFKDNLSYVIEHQVKSQYELDCKLCFYTSAEAKAIIKKDIRNEQRSHISRVYVLESATKKVESKSGRHLIVYFLPRCCHTILGKIMVCLTSTSLVLSSLYIISKLFLKFYTSLLIANLKFYLPLFVSGQ